MVFRGVECPMDGSDSLLFYITYKESLRVPLFFLYLTYWRSYTRTRVLFIYSYMDLFHKIKMTSSLYGQVVRGYPSMIETNGILHGWGVRQVCPTRGTGFPCLFPPSR